VILAPIGQSTTVPPLHHSLTVTDQTIQQNLTNPQPSQTQSSNPKTNHMGVHAVDDREHVCQGSFHFVEAVHCQTPVLKSTTEASIRVPRMFNHTHSNNMINK
jgi:hypothetical protein